MSYEGTEVYYCVRGHLVKSVDYLTEVNCPSNTVCEVCKELGLDTKEFVVDSVDHTNGCMCDWLEESGQAEERCPAHETVTKILRYDMIRCERCGGAGKVSTVKLWGYKPCLECEGEDPACRWCFGTKFAPEPIEYVEVDCPACKGKETIPEPVWNIQHLLDEKSRWPERIVEEEEPCDCGSCCEEED